MYIRKVELKNIRSIGLFKMEFDEQPAGWHVLIGDNGAGKSGIIRAIATALVGPEEIQGIKPNWNNQLKWNQKKGSIRLELERSNSIDVQGGTAGVGGLFPVQLNLVRKDIDYVTLDTHGGALSQAKNTLWGGKTGWFSAGYGPFRRFTGGDSEMSKVFENPRYSRLASHLSLFGEDVALTEATKWLINLRLQVYEKKVSKGLFDDLRKFINSPDFLPHKTKLKEVSSDGVSFTDGNGAEISVYQLSDGYRSILSLTFELIRQLVRVYGEDKVFRKIRKGEMEIDTHGVVLIDEIDAHLHPTWQTRIGQWFLKYFPKIQFIVTTHSPLVCRACSNGTIWRLAAPDTDMKSGEVKLKERDRLIYGNVLDAYSTNVFGEGVSISEESNEKLNRLAELNMKSVYGEKLDEQEKNELAALKTIFPTEKTDVK